MPQPISLVGRSPQELACGRRTDGLEASSRQGEERLVGSVQRDFRIWDVFLVGCRKLASVPVTKECLLVGVESTNRSIRAIKTHVFVHCHSIMHNIQLQWSPSNVDTLGSW